MILPRRAPREVYRVYREDEFLAASDCAESDTDRSTSTTESRGLRTAGAATLIGLCGAVVAIVAVNVQRSARPRTGRALGRPSRIASLSRAPLDSLAPRRVSVPRERRVPPRAHRRRLAPRLHQRAHQRTGRLAHRAQTPGNAADTSHVAVRAPASLEHGARRAAGEEFGFEH